MNHLIGLSYQWGAIYSIDGKVDCFSLFQEGRNSLGLHNYAKEFAWVYQEASQAQIPTRKILEQLHSIGKQVKSPSNGDLALVSASANQIGVGMFFNDGVLSIRKDGLSFWTPMGTAVHYWTLFA
jgi:hypothetical protein